MGDPQQRPPAAAAARLQRPRHRRPTSSSTSKRSSTASCSASSCCCTGCCTSSRFAVAEGAAPSACWLEKWRGEAITSGARALDQLRDGVQKAITTLGTGFLRHPANAALRENVDVDGPARRPAAARLPAAVPLRRRGPGRSCTTPTPSEQARDRYARYFSTARLRAPCAPPPRAPRTATSTRRCGSCSTRSATRTAAPSWGCPASAASSTDTAGRRAAARPAPVQRAPARRRPASRPGPRRRLRPLARRSTTATSTPRSWARSTSRCWSWSRRHSAVDLHLRAGRGRRQRPQDDRLLLHAVVADRAAARLRTRPGDRRRRQARRAGRRRPPDPADGDRRRAARR